MDFGTKIYALFGCLASVESFAFTVPPSSSVGPPVEVYKEATAFPITVLAVMVVPGIAMLVLSLVAMHTPSASLRVGVTAVGATGVEVVEPVVPVVVTGLSGMMSSFFVQEVTANVPAMTSRLKCLMVVFMVLFKV